MVAVMHSTSSSTGCEPRFATQRTDRPTRGHEIARIAEGFGQPLMPWQRLVADVASEYDPKTGLPVYREVIVTVPRQSGKTTLILAWELHRALMWGSPQKIAYTAQTGQDARMKLIEDQYDSILALSPMRSAIKQAKRAMGATALVFRNGSRIDALATSAEAGHGKTLGLAVIDEAMADEDDRREQGLRPTMVTVDDAQMLIFSTAGTERSVFLKRKVELGRHAVTEGFTEGISYFEWSAAPDQDINDPVEWRKWMPALGHTISEASVEADRLGMSDGEFRRAYGNQWTVSDERVIPHNAWAAVCGPSVAPAHPGLVYAIDATPDFGMAAIACADKQGRAALVDHHEGTGWLLERVVALSKETDAPVVVDRYGPVGFLIDELKARLIPVVEVDTRAYAYAAAGFFTNVMDGKVAIRSHEDLDQAVAAARKRKAGDSWVWARQNTESDISPLVAVTLALGEAFRPDKYAQVGVMVV